MRNSIYILQKGIRESYGPEVDHFIVCSDKREKLIEYLKEIEGGCIEGKEDQECIDVSKNVTYYISEVKYIN